MSSTCGVIPAEDVEATQHAHVLLDALVVYEHIIKTDPEHQVISQKQMLHIGELDHILVYTLRR